jgi:arginase family enzyme
MMRRFWLEFAVTVEHRLGSLLLPGIGVTALDQDDALELIKRDVTRGEELPAVSRVVADIDVSTLDPGHVLPGVGDPSRRGVWFPRAFQR